MELSIKYDELIDGKSTVHFGLEGLAGESADDWRVKYKCPR
jgi:hypothetical protein